MLKEIKNKVKYFYIERHNIADGMLNGFWTAESATAENVYNNFYDEGEDAQGVYEPWIAEITEDEVGKFPCIFPKEWEYGGEAE